MKVDFEIRGRFCNYFPPEVEAALEEGENQDPLFDLETSQESEKPGSQRLRKFFHAFSALSIVFLSIFQWNRIDSNYHSSNAHEFENAPNKNADKSFVNDYQNAPHHVTSFFKKPSSTATKEKIIMVCFKKNHLTVEKVNLKSSNFVGFLVH